MRQQLQHLSRGSSIVNVTAGAGLRPEEGISLYSAAKAGVNALSSAGAREYGPRGVRVNAVAPGVTLTPPVLLPANSQIVKSVVDSTPLGRAGQPEEVAKAIAFLLSDEASYISGVVLRCDGGYLSLSH